MTRYHSRQSRPGFTLIEMLTVISIMLILGAMVVAVAWTASDKKKVSNGATDLVGWIKIAQATALRDQTPNGIRLNVAGGSTLVTQIQVIDQPPDWVAV